MSEHFLFIQTILNQFVRKLLIMAILLMLLTMNVLLFVPLATYAAADPSSAQLNQSLGLRVKVEYETEADQGNIGHNERAAGDLADLLSDEWLDIDTDKWEKSGDYYYYQTPLQSGECVVFMESVRIPPFIDSTAAGITFHIRIIAEVFPLVSEIGKTPLPKNDEQIKVSMRELELNQTELRAFTNNQTVVPGQKISKIVLIHVYDSRQPIVDQTDSTPPSDHTKEKSQTESDETPVITYVPDIPPNINVTVNTETPVSIPGNSIDIKSSNNTMNKAIQSIPGNKAQTLPSEEQEEKNVPAVLAAHGLTNNIRSSGRAVKGRIREFLTGDDSGMMMWLGMAMVSMLLMFIYAAGLYVSKDQNGTVPITKINFSGTAVQMKTMIPEKTLAFLTDRDQKINQLSLGEVKTAITELYDPPELTAGTNVFRKSVRIQNTGTAPCYVRAFLSVSDSDIAQKTWFAASEEEAAANRFVLSTEYMANLPPGWLFNEIDNYCYYTTVLQPGEETTPLIYAVKTVFTNEEEVRPYEIIVYQEAVQAIYEKTAGNAGTPEYEAAWRANMHHENE